MVAFLRRMKTYVTVVQRVGREPIIEVDTDGDERQMEKMTMTMETGF